MHKINNLISKILLKNKPLTESSRHCAHILAVMLVVEAIQGQEFISMSHTLKSSDSMKSALKLNLGF
jgi:hypothetical protein